jgi:hypothetical protein
VNSESKNAEESGYVLIWILPQQLPIGTERYHKNRCHFIGVPAALESKTSLIQARRIIASANDRKNNK